MTTPEHATPSTPISVVGVQFRVAGIVHDYDSGDLALVRGDRVVVESQRSVVLATVARPPVAGPSENRPPRVLRKADARDLARQEQNQQRERDAHRLCLVRIRERRMAMKLIQVDYNFDASKAVFYFCAEGRVDFRELVRDLAQALRTRIEMKQIGTRDETKMLGGVGPCGRELCCSTWLREFQAVSVRWRRSRACRSTRRSSRACAGGSSAACATSTRPTSS